MTLSRYDSERLRAIEEQLKAEDPEYARSLERFAADIPDSPVKARGEPGPRSTLVLFCGWFMGALLLLGLIMSLSSGADGGRTDIEQGSANAPGAEVSRMVGPL
ncbi:DUF3040 domain-containing protein [Allosalinactinospora lopnorensis]|uniref:DUF3040 domain-containing protein n=1 Tax=Allosalinactinospora lopnorensis TaxID=1352348 RepID=UPI000623CB66|nr:DUF3040 domain-containing protein [Allosalinactinospora lopnorensis]